MFFQFLKVEAQFYNDGSPGENPRSHGRHPRGQRILQVELQLK
jgi:hypothetical protein